MNLSITNLKSLLYCMTAILLVIIMHSCIEPYEGTVEGFDDVLVVNAVITNEFKKQEVRLNRSYRFEEEEPKVKVEKESIKDEPTIVKNDIEKVEEVEEVEEIDEDLEPGIVGEEDEEGDGEEGEETEGDGGE